MCCLLVVQFLGNGIVASRETLQKKRREMGVSTLTSAVYFRFSPIPPKIVNLLPNLLLFFCVTLLVCRVSRAEIIRELRISLYIRRIVRYNGHGIVLCCIYFHTLLTNSVCFLFEKTFGLFSTFIYF